MKKQMEKLRDKVEDALRHACGRIDSDNKVRIVAIAFAIFAVSSLFVFVRAIYAIGKDDGRKEIAVEHIKQAPIALPFDSTIIKPIIENAYETR